MGPRSAFHKSSVPLLAVALALLAAPAAADDYADMVAAEKAFASDASARGTRAAFLAALADDGVVFDAGPGEGKRVWQARKDSKTRLEWTPELAEIAASGDLGYTVGPWRITPEGAKAPAAHGHYFTVWQKQPDGHWKFLVDHGIGHAAVPFPETVQRRGGLGVGPPPSWPVGVAELRSADLLAPGALDKRRVSADFLRLRNGQLPDGRAEGTAFASSARRVRTGLAVSAAGDLAVTWGGSAEGPSWLRVWRRPAASDPPGQGWQLAVDLGLPGGPER